MKGAYETGIYRNVFAELGIDEAEIEKRKEEIFQTLFYGTEDERIYHPVGDDMGYMEDTGNHDALLDAADFVAAFQKRQGLYISCIEEIAYKRGFIDKQQLLDLAEPLMKTDYGKYLAEVANGL